MDGLLWWLENKFPRVGALPIKPETPLGTMPAADWANRCLLISQPIKSPLPITMLFKIRSRLIWFTKIFHEMILMSLSKN